MHDEAFRIATARYLRLSSSPRAAAHFLEMNTQIGSRVVFEDRGMHTLKGVPDEWQLFAAL
jgi:hypothetical protein